MSAWVDIPIGTKSYRPRSGTQSIERLINLYAHPSAPGAKTGVTLIGTPGLAAWTTVGNGPIRGLHRALGYVWTVTGSDLYAVNETTKAATLIGTIGSVGPVRMINNSTHVVVTTLGDAYYASIAGGVHLLPQTQLIGAAYQDGYGIYVQRNTQNVWISDVDDLTDIDALDFTTADAQPDNVIACLSHRREVWVLKERTGEIFYDSGNASFPFERIGGGFIERGIASSGSLCSVGDFVMWLGDDLRVYRAASYVPEAVSTEDIDRLISAAYAPDSAEAFSYTQAGHLFYVLTFADLTIVYDASTGAWHERSSYGLDRWLAHSHVQVGDTHLVGHYNSNAIYELDLDTYSDVGEDIIRTMVAPPLSDDPNPIFVHGMHLDIEAGVGLTSGQGSDPTVLLSWSDDDGRTWSSDVESSIGALGNYRYAVDFLRLGRSTNRSWRVRISDPVKVAILGARARIEAGAR